MRNTQLKATQEITGTAAQAFGNIFIPSSGTITARIMGDILQTTLTSGFERKEVLIRIQNIDSIETTEAPIYAQLSLGVSMTLLGLGVIFANVFLGFLCLVVGIVTVVWAIQKKRRLLVIYSLRSAVPIYMNKPSEEYQQFTRQVMAIARHLNNPPMQQPRQNGQTESRPDNASSHNEFRLQQ